jgi:lipopolysaccharide transport system ATP-binding protein
MSEPIIAFEHVGKSYPQYHHITGGIKRFLFNLPEAIRQFKQSRYEALNDVSFAVQRGEVFGIIGRNGAGKSTTLGLIAGVLRPTTGHVQIRGRISPLLELGAGFNQELSGRENIFLCGVLMGLTRQEVAARLNDIIAFSELGDFIDQPIRIYSSGMLARLGFSVVSSLDPEILLIDEILAVGDIAFQKKCMDRMLDFKKRGVTMVFVSHSLKSTQEICDRLMWIENHTVRMIGDPQTVADAYLAAQTPMPAA